MCELVKEYQKTKNDKLYGEIYNKYNKRLEGFLRVKFNNISSQIIDDALIESFEHARINIDKYDSTRAFSTWFYTLAIRLTIKLIDKEKNYVATIFENGQTDHENIVINNLAKKILDTDKPDHDPLLSKINIYNSEGDKMLNAYDSVVSEINNLKSDIKSVFIDSYLNNMTFDKIMIKHNLTESQVKLKLLTGRKDIRKIYHDRNVDKLKTKLKTEHLNIPEHLSVLIHNKLKYCGELLHKNNNFVYYIPNKKNNIKTIEQYVVSNNNKVSKEFINYNTILKIEEDSSYAKKHFDSNLKSLNNEGYILHEDELNKAIKLKYSVFLKGITTRNKSGKVSSNDKLIKVQKLKLVKPGKNIILINKNKNKSYTNINVIENNNIQIIIS